MSLSFKRTTEDFTCEHCGQEVQGNGYTNHCPKCLWGKHVDVNPGDRAESCGGLMEPIGVTVDGGTFTITHRCKACRFTRRNKAAEADNFEALLEFSTRPIN